MNESTRAPQLESFMNEAGKETGGHPVMNLGIALKPEPVPEQVASSNKNDSNIPKRKRRSPRTPWKKPKDMPKRPLSAYNLFFQWERERLLGSTHGSVDSNADDSNDQSKKSPVADQVSSSDLKPDDDAQNSEGEERKDRVHLKTSGIGFANLAKTIASKWKVVDPETRARFEATAAIEKERYNNEMAVWRHKKKIENERKTLPRAPALEVGLRSDTFSGFQGFSHLRRPETTPQSLPGFFRIIPTPEKAFLPFFRDGNASTSTLQSRKP